MAMSNIGVILSSVVNGAIAGAIGAGVSESSDNPVLKGAIVTGLISGGITTAFIAITTPALPASSGTVSGLQKEWGLR